MSMNERANEAPGSGGKAAPLRGKDWLCLFGLNLSLPCEQFDDKRASASHSLFKLASVLVKNANLTARTINHVAL